MVRVLDKCRASFKVRTSRWQNHCQQSLRTLSSTQIAQQHDLHNASSSSTAVANSSTPASSSSTPATSSFGVFSRGGSYLNARVVTSHDAISHGCGFFNLRKDTTTPLSIQNNPAIRSFSTSSSSSSSGDLGAFGSRSLSTSAVGDDFRSFSSVSSSKERQGVVRMRENMAPIVQELAEFANRVKQNEMTLDEFLTYIVQWQDRSDAQLKSWSVEDLMDAKLLLLDEIIGDRQSMERLLDNQAAARPLANVGGDIDLTKPEPINMTITSINGLRRAALSVSFLAAWEKCAMAKFELTKEERSPKKAEPVDSKASPDSKATDSKITAANTDANDVFESASLSNSIHSYAANSIRPSAHFYVTWQAAVLNKLESFDPQSFSNALLSLAFLNRKFGIRPEKEFLEAYPKHFEFIMSKHDDFMRLFTELQARAETTHFDDPNGSALIEDTLPPATQASRFLFSSDNYSNIVFAFGVLEVKLSANVVSLIEREFLRLTLQGLSPDVLSHVVFAFDIFWAELDRKERRFEYLPSNLTVPLVAKKSSENSSSSSGSEVSNEFQLQDWANDFSKAMGMLEKVIDSDEISLRQQSKQNFLDLNTPKLDRQRMENAHDAINNIQITIANWESTVIPLLGRISDTYFDSVLQAMKTGDRNHSRAKDDFSDLGSTLLLFENLIFNGARLLRQSKFPLHEVTWNTPSGDSVQLILLESTERLGLNQSFSFNFDEDEVIADKLSEGKDRDATSSSGENQKDQRPFLQVYESLAMEVLAKGMKKYFAVRGLLAKQELPDDGESITSPGEGASNVSLPAKSENKQIADKLEAAISRLALHTACSFSRLTYTPSDSFLIQLQEAILLRLRVTDTPEEISTRTLTHSLLFITNLLDKKKPAAMTAASTINANLGEGLTSSTKEFLERWESITLMSLDRFEPHDLVLIVVQFGELGRLNPGLHPSDGFMKIWELKCIERMRDFRERDVISAALAFGRFRYATSSKFAESYGQRVQELLLSSSDSTSDMI